MEERKGFFACGEIQRTCSPECYGTEKHSCKKYIEEIPYTCAHFDKYFNNI